MFGIVGTVACGAETKQIAQAPVFFDPLALRKACLSGRHALSGGFGMFELPQAFRGSTVRVHA